jgi:hypothetical protein
VKHVEATVAGDHAVDQRVHERRRRHVAGMRLRLAALLADEGGRLL